MSKTMETEVVKPFEWDEIPKIHKIQINSKTTETQVGEPFEWDGIPTGSFLVGFSSKLDLANMDRQFVFYTTRFV